MKKTWRLLAFAAALGIALAGCRFPWNDGPTGQTLKKPVIYLYPTQETQVNVKLNLHGTLTKTLPASDGNWSVTAYPDGHLINQADGKEYSYLFWEGKADVQYDFSKGFVVPGKDTAVFLQKELAVLGLTPREYNEFIVYWLPQMQDNSYNLIAFQTNVYTDLAKLDISPKPDSELRVFMAYKPLKKPVKLPEQTLPAFERKGFAVVEWGGSRVD